jgi:hypothetical protein
MIIIFTAFKKNENSSKTEEYKELCMKNHDNMLTLIIILALATHTMHACQMIGMPESDVLLAQCVIYLSRTEKSKEIQNALNKSKSVIENHMGPQPKVPLIMKVKSEPNKHGDTLGI